MTSGQKFFRFIPICNVNTCLTHCQKETAKIMPFLVRKGIKKSKSVYLSKRQSQFRFQKAGKENAVYPLKKRLN